MTRKRPKRRKPHRTKFHIVPFVVDRPIPGHTRRRWKATKDGDPWVGIWFRQDDAVTDVCAAARKCPPSQVFIHGRDGKVRDERTYGSDPCPPKG